MFITFGTILQQVQPLQGQNLEKEMELAGWIMLIAVKLRTGRYLNVRLEGQTWDLVMIMMLVLSVGMNKE